METDNFMKDNLWIMLIVVLLFTAFVAYVLNKNNDPEEDEGNDIHLWQDEVKEEEDKPKNDTDED